MVLNAVVLAAFTLVGAEKSATVVVPENAKPSTLLCVEELTNYVAKITGVILQVKVEGLGLQRTGNVYIGTLKTLKDVPAVAKAALEKSKKSTVHVVGFQMFRARVRGHNSHSRAQLLKLNIG